MKELHGASLNFVVVQSERTSVSITVVIKSKTDGSVQEFTETFVDGKASFAISTLDVGKYEYQINENYDSGAPDKFPNNDNCDGDCTFPEIIICAALDTEES